MKKQTKTLQGDPNFSIVLPGKCQGSCKFCCWEFKSTPNQYVDRLRRAINRLPDEFKRVTITGGEPTLSGYLGVTVDVLRETRDWDAVVLSSNGAKLGDYTDLQVDHVNLSRHHHDLKKREEIFDAVIPCDMYVMDVIDRFNCSGVDVTLVALLCDQFVNNSPDPQGNDIIEFVKYADNLGASAVTFRTDCHKNSTKPPKEMKWVSEYKTNDRWSCEACRIWTQIIRGKQVQWKAAKAEPSQIHGVPYELIFQQDCKLTTDWAGKDEYKPDCCPKKNKKNKKNKPSNPYSPGSSFQRCGFVPRCGG